MKTRKLNLSRMVPKKLSQTIGRQTLKLKKNSPAILMVAGGVGFAATVVTASMATLKAQEVVQRHKDNSEIAKDLFESNHKDYSKDDYNKDQFYIWCRTAVALGKLYAPSVLLGVATVTCFTSSYKIMNKRNLGLAAAYSGLEKAYEEYRERVAEELGDEREEEIRLGMRERETVNEDGEKTTEKTVTDKLPSQYARFFDESNRNYQNDPALNRMFLSCQQNYANDLLINRQHLFLNEVYDMLGMKRTQAGSVTGWVISDDGTDNFVDFGIFDSNNLEKRMFVNGDEKNILLDFNVNGVIYDRI